MAFHQSFSISYGALVTQMDLGQSTQIYCLSLFATGDVSSGKQSEAL